VNDQQRDVLISLMQNRPWRITVYQGQALNFWPDLATLWTRPDDIAPNVAPDLTIRGAWVLPGWGRVQGSVTLHYGQKGWTFTRPTIAGNDAITPALLQPTPVKRTSRQHKKSRLRQKAGQAGPESPRHRDGRA